MFELFHQPAYCRSALNVADIRAILSDYISQYVAQRLWLEWTSRAYILEYIDTYYTDDYSDYDDEEEMIECQDRYTIIRYNNMIGRIIDNRQLYTNIKLLNKNNYNPALSYYRCRTTLVIHKYKYSISNFMNCDINKIHEYIRIITKKSSCKLGWGLIMHEDIVYSVHSGRSKYLNANSYIIRDLITNMDIFRFNRNGNRIEYYDINRGHIIIEGDKILLHHIAI